MPQITKDPLGNDVELLSLTEWSEKNQRELNEDTLNQYAGYATGQFLRAGQARESFENDLYGSLYQKGQEAGIFQPQSDEEANQQFQNFTSKPFVNDALDLDLVSKSLLDTEPEQAAKVADVYQRVSSGQADPNLDLDLEDVKTNIATPDRIQQARIDYAKERGLAFIDYPTGDGKRDVWINTQIKPDRNAIYGTLETTQGIVDPRAAQQAEEWIKTDPGRTMSNAERRRLGELQENIQQQITADPNSALSKNLFAAIDHASEVANEFGERAADLTGKPPTDTYYEQQTLQTVTGPVYTQKKYQLENRDKIADAVLRNTYAKIKNDDPNNVLVTEYTEEEFLNAGRDFTLQRLNVPTDRKDPTKNFVTLTDGTRMPLSSAAILPQKEFTAAMDKLGLDEQERALAKTVKTGWIAANLVPIQDALYDYESDELMDFYEKNKDVYKNDVEFTEAYIDQMKVDGWKTFKAKAAGIAWSIPRAFHDLGWGLAFLAGRAVGGVTGWNGMSDFTAGVLEQGAELDQRRSTYTDLYGSKTGAIYEFASQAAPMLADILVARGAGTVAKQYAKGAVNVGIKSAEKIMGDSVKNLIKGSLKDETKGIIGKYLKPFTVGGIEQNPSKMLRAVRRDLEEKFVTGSARATQLGASFTRSAQGTYVNTSMTMRSETNPDGSPKYTEDEIRKTATANALVSGSITALVEYGFGRVFGEGADVTTLGNANIRQLKYYSNRLTNAIQRGGFGGQELLDTLNQVTKEIVKKGWGEALTQIPAEAAEEFTDEFSQNIALSLLNDENVNFKEAFEQGLKAAVMGGGYGAIFGTTNKIGLRKANVIRDTFMGDAQRIERDIMDQTIAKLQEAGGNPQTVAALQERVRMAQRRGQAVSQTIPVRTQAKQDLVGQIDAVEENPIEISATTTTTQNKPAVDAKPTKLAAQEAKELGVTDDELKFIPPSGKNQSITPNDVRAYVNRRTENLGITLSGFLPGQEVTAPEGGFQSIGEDQIDDPEQRTFNDLNNRVVIIDGLRGRLRIEDEGVILDPEDGSTPFEVTPNKDLPIKDFEGFDTLLQEGAQVTPRRQPREVAEVTDGGQIVYGETTYDLPEQPLLANVKRNAAGEIESMHMRVFNSKGLATWVYVAGDNVPKVETAYRVRGPESVVTYNNAVENSRAENVKRNAAANSFKAKQSRARRKKKRIENNAPYVSDTAQETVQASADYRMAKINDPAAPKQLIEEIRGIALQLGIDPDVVTDNAELFAMVAPDLAAGLDLESFTPRQIAKAIENLRRSGNNPETLLEYALLDEVLDPVQRVTRDSKLAALRARNSNQIKKHGLKPGADVKKALESIARTAANKEHREAAKALLELEAYNTPVSFVYLSNNLGTAGAYLPSSNAVVVNLASDNGGGALDALLHELGHAVTDRVVTNPRNEHERQLRDKLLALRAEYMNRANNLFGENNVPPDLRYALEGRMYTSEQYDEISGAREMVAHFYGSKRFREYLAQMSPEGERSFIQKFIDLIASIFGRGEASTRQYRELANLVSDISRANQTLGDNPYGRSTAQYAASRAAVNKANRVGPLFGVENPHPREDVKWIIHQVQTLRFADYSNEEFNEMILNGKFGMLTGEFPNAVDGVTEADNARFNREATKWLRDRGYEIIPIAGHYERGENSFFVPGLTDQDAVDASYELNQVSVVTDTGSYSRDGMFSPRTGQAINKPIQEEGDAYFSAVLDTNGNVTTMRVHYDFDTVLDSGLRYSKQDTQASPTTKIARSLAAQNEFVVAESSETNRPLHFENGVLIVNPALAEARYGEFDVEDSADLQELDARLAVATGLAVQSSGPEIQLDLEEVGLSPETVIEQAAYNDLTKSDLEDLLKVKDQAKQLVASAYYQVALRNDGSNERLATAQNRLADLYRYLLRDGAEPSDTVEKYNPYEVSDLTARIAERAKPPLPIVRFSRAAAEIDPKQVRSRTKAGATVGTRNPTAAKATEDGSDPSNTVDLATLKRNPKAYRKNALLLLEYPIVAREFPELAKEYADLRNKVVNAQEEAKSNGGNISSAKLAAKKILAKHLGNISVTKVKSQMFEDARENPEKEVSGKYLAEFKAAIENISNYEKKGVELVADSKKALKEFGDALDAMAVDNNHPIAEQADRIYETLIDVSRSNLEMLMKIFPDSIRDIADLWYDGANLIAQQFAGSKYTIEQSAAVLAVFSPQKDWFMNVELGRRTMEIWTDDQDYVWDDAMSKRWLMRGGEPELIERKDGSLGYKGDIKPDLDENGEHRTDENGMLLFLGWSSSKAEARRKLAFERLKDLKGKKLKDLTPEQQAWFIRMRAETKYPTSFPIVTPDGDFEGPSTSTNNKGEVREIKLAWGTYGSIGKAIEILTAPRETQMKVISDALGDKHKVRSFYNNIVDPQNTSGHVTMDTHAIAALHLIPLSGNSREVSQNFGSAGTASDSLTGIAGLYPAYAEVYRRSGFDRLPRQVQSITWEAIRILFPAKWKSDSKNVNAIRDIWKRYQSKEITLAEAQSEVFEKATGGKDLEVAIKNSDNPELNIPFPSWAKITEGPAPAGVALSRALPIQLANIDKNFVAEFGQDYKYEIRNRLSANRAELNGGVDVAIDRLFGAAATGIEGEVRTDKLFAEATTGAQKAWRKTVDKIMLAAGYDAKAWRENYNGSPKGSKARDEIKSLQSANIKFLMGDEPTVSMGGPDFNRAYADLENSLSAALGSENNTIRTTAENLLGAYSLAFGPEVPSIALSRAVRVSEPVRLSKEQRTQSVELISSLTGADQKTRRGVFDGLVNLSNDDLLSVTERLNKKTLRWLIGSAAEDQSKVDLLSTLRRAVRKQIENAPQYQQGAALFREDGVRRVPIDRLAARVVLSRAAGADTAPKAFRGRTVQLTHWSKATELKQTDPAEHGNGGAGEELKRRREYGDIYLPRTYFGYGKYHREQQVGGNRYSMLVNGDTLYDLDRDPLDLYPGQDDLQKAGYARFDNRAARTLYEKAIKDAGFKGYVSTSFQAGVLFNKQKVTKVRDANTSLPLAPPAAIAKSIGGPIGIPAFKQYIKDSGFEYLVYHEVAQDGGVEEWDRRGGVTIDARRYPTAVIGDTRVAFTTEGLYLDKGKVQASYEADTDENGNTIYTISRIVTDPKSRGTGQASKAMSAITDAADKSGLTLQLEPEVISTLTKKGEKFLNKEQLIDWYKKNGFVQKFDGSDNILLRKPSSLYGSDTAPRYSKALYAIVSPDVESAYAVSLEDLYINNATGEWDAGGPIKNLFRAAGDLDPRLFEAAKYQERGLKLAKVRLKDLIQGFKAALKAEPNADLDDINVALGSTEPTVSAAQRDAAESARRARVDKANEQFDRDPANQAYAAAVEAARVAYATHRNKQKYTAEIQQARDARKNSPEMQRRDAAIAAADAQYAKDIQDARAKNLIPIRRAQQQAQLRLEANSPQTAQVIADFRVAIDNLSAQLSAELGPSNPLSAIVDQNLGIYLTRSYRIHQDEGYAQRVRNDSEFAHQREQARQFFEREWIATTYEKWRSDVAYEPYSDAEVMALVRAEAASKNVGTRDLYKFIDKHGSTPKTIGRTTSRTDLTRFMQKGEVPAELRPLLGEIQNPIENAMRTYANLAQFLGTQRLLSQYTQLGLDNGWLVPAADVDNDPVKYDGYKPLVNSTDTRGGEPLSEYYAQPDVIEAFQTMFNPAAKAQRSYAKKAIDGAGAVAARAVGGAMGALTLGSAGFFTRNITGILTFVGANGFIPTPSNVIASLRTLKEVYGKNMGGIGADAVMLGLTQDSMTSGAMRDFMRNAVEDPETVTNQIDSMLKELSTPGNWLLKAWKTAKVTVDALATFNDQIDSFYKIAYWAHEIDVQTKANKHRATPLTPDQIKQEAARVVRQTTQGRERVFPIAKEFSRSGFGMLLNSFFRFTAEMYRLPVATFQLAAQEMSSGNPVLKNRGRWRLAGLGATLALSGHGAQALMKMLFGFGDDEEEAIRKGQPVYARDANLFFTHDPEDGTVSVVDATYANSFSPVVDMFGRSLHHALNGRWEKVPETLFKGIAKNFVSPQIVVEALAQASNNTNDYGAALWLEDDSFRTKASKFLKHVIGNAYKLRTPTEFYKAFAAYANNGVYDKDAAIKLGKRLGNEFKPFRVKTDPVEEHAARAFKVLKREMDEARSSLRGFNSYDSMSQEDVDQIYDRYENSSIAINERLNKFARGFQKLGLSYKQLQKIAYEQADISKNRFEQAVKYGRVERFVPSDDALEMYEKRGGDNGPARVQYLKQAYKKRPRYTYLKKR